MSFIAKYRGECCYCWGTISPGESVDYTTMSELVHSDCDPTPATRPDPPVCTDCWLIHWGECE